MIAISNIVKLISGTPQFRITEDFSNTAPTYFFYGQLELEQDLTGLEDRAGNQKQIKTLDSVCITEEGGVIFSLISGKAAMVQSSHSGYLLTQNYLKLLPSRAIDAKYLVYMLNENRDIKHQLQSSQQGSATLKYTIAQLSTIAFPVLPPIEKQKIIGELYFNQLKLEALKKRSAALETTLVLENIKEAIQQ